jgi:mediator of RNA polymerase II transcription subunit 18
LQLLDSSGTYILEAKVRVQDFKDASVLESMRGCVELSLPDRIAMDTRVKYKLPQGVLTAADIKRLQQEAQARALAQEQQQ